MPEIDQSYANGIIKMGSISMWSSTSTIFAISGSLFLLSCASGLPGAAGQRIDLPTMYYSNTERYAQNELDHLSTVEIDTLLRAQSDNIPQSYCCSLSYANIVAISNFNDLLGEEFPQIDRDLFTYSFQVELDHLIVTLRPKYLESDQYLFEGIWIPIGNEIHGHTFTVSADGTEVLSHQFTE